MNKHDAPENEGAARAAQFAAMSLTVMEAMARLRAQRQAERTEADDRAAQAARAERIASHAEARVMWSQALDDGWLRSAGTGDVGRCWAAAIAWADTDVQAADAVRRTETRLYELHPDAMLAYAAARAEGLDPSAAMQRATDQFVERPMLDAGDAISASTKPRPPHDVAAEGYPLPASAAVQRGQGRAPVITTAPPAMRKAATDTKPVAHAARSRR